MAKLRLAGVIKESIVDGPGIRFVIFSQGCLHNCLGCHNPQTHDLDGGYESDTEKILEEIKKNPLLKGVTFSGGDPFLQPRAFTQLAKEIHKLGLDIVAYSGYTIEQLLKKEDCMTLLKEIDVLIDGPYIQEKRSIELDFKGSSNQRTIDMKKYFKTL